MSWRSNQTQRRSAHLASCDAAEVERYHAIVGKIGRADEDAYLSDLARVFSFRDGMKVLDAGAGTGTVSSMLSRIAGLSLTALEPASAMLAELKAQPELAGVRTVEGFCDHIEDRAHFEQGTFDVVVSRQLGNELFDPLAAFANWHHWLVPGGSVVVMDGLYGRDAWAGDRESEVNELPLSVCQTTALVPYLLEAAGFAIEAVEPMVAANAMPATRTERYMVGARKLG